MVWRKKTFLGGVVVAILAVYPVQETVAPEWHINVTDDSAVPLAGIKITEVWQDYTVERSSHEDDASTDDRGHVLFARRTIRAPFIRRAYGAVRNIASQGAHASFGPHAYLVIDYPCGYGNNDAHEFGQNEAHWSGGSKVVYQSLILHRCKNGRSGIVCMQ